MRAEIGWLQIYNWITRIVIVDCGQGGGGMEIPNIGPLGGVSGQNREKKIVTSLNILGRKHVRRFDLVLCLSRPGNRPALDYVNSEV